jgi:hypothetical protein
VRGRCGRGERLRSKAPFGHWKTQTFVAGLRGGALTAQTTSKPQDTDSNERPML